MGSLLRGALGNNNYEGLREAGGAEGEIEQPCWCSHGPSRSPGSAGAGVVLQGGAKMKQVG